MSKSKKKHHNSCSIYPDQGAGSDPKASGLASKMGVMICFSQGDLPSPSASSSSSKDNL